MHFVGFEHFCYTLPILKWTLDSLTYRKKAQNSAEGGSVLHSYYIFVIIFSFFMIFPSIHLSTLNMLHLNLSWTASRILIKITTAYCMKMKFIRNRQSCSTKTLNSFFSIATMNLMAATLFHFGVMFLFIFSFFTYANPTLIVLTCYQNPHKTLCLWNNCNETMAMKIIYLWLFR